MIRDYKPLSSATEDAKSAHYKGTKKRFNLLIRARAFYDEFTDDTAYQRRTFTRVFTARDAKDAKVAKRTKNNNFTYINDLWSR